MSYSNFEKALEMAKNCDGYKIGNGCSEETIDKAEALLGIGLSKQIRKYLSEYGYIEFFGSEIYGIIDESFEVDGEDNEGCMVEWTLNERENSGLNDKWIALKFEDDGAMVFLDFSSINDEGEPQIIVALDNGDGYEFECVIADDFGEFLLELVEIQLDEY